MTLATRRTIGTKHFMRLPMVFIDIETTGDSLAVGGEICEAGLVKVDPMSLEIIDRADLMFQVDNPRGRTEDELSYHGYNGYSRAAWRAALPQAEALRRFNEFARGCSPWAYNVSFEFQWLAGYYDRYDINWGGDYHWFDLMTMARVVLEEQFRLERLDTLSLSSIGTFLGLPEEAMPHRGLAGAQYELEIFRRLSAVPRTT